MTNQKELNAKFSYDHDKGWLLWKIGRCPSFSGKRAGYYHRKGGYRKIYFQGRAYFEHVIIWAMHHGWSDNIIDHINGIKDDNRIENLREATRSQNAANSKNRENSATGKKGVHFSKEKGKFQAHICKDYKKIHLGFFDELEDAVAAYDRAAVKIFGEFYKTNRGSDNESSYC